LTINSDPDLKYVHFFFVDVIGLSDPSMSTKTQIKKIQVLQNCIKECATYNNSKDKIINPTGDGMAIGFIQRSDFPLKLAIELHEKLSSYNKAKIPSEIIEIRIGLHSGNIYIIDDILGNKNLWGSGIIIAKRIMDLGDSGHILLSQRMAEDLLELSDEYKKIIKPLHELVIKHGQKIMIYNAFDQNLGNADIPKKALDQITRADVFRLNKNTLYNFVNVNIRILDTDSMFVHHKRTYEIINTSDEPIKEILHGIAIDIPQSLDALNLKVYDEQNNEMKISRILTNYPYQKEFATMFNTPILKNEHGRTYTIEYQVKEPERFFANTFLVDCAKFEIEFEYNDCNGINPILYEVNHETDEITKSNIIPTIKKSEKTVTICWIKNKITKGETYQINW
jgi:hypothetical protein